MGSAGRPASRYRAGLIGVAASDQWGVAGTPNGLAS
jgi:hypothetical protein